MTTGVRIRPATPAEFPGLAGVENESDRLLIEWFGASPDHWHPAPPRRADDADMVTALVAVIRAVAQTEPGGGRTQGGHSDEVTAGFVQLDAFDGAAAVIDTLAVRPAYTRRGIGRALVRETIAVATRRGYRELWLRTYESVPWNAPFYASEGFELAGSPDSGPALARWAGAELEHDRSHALPAPEDRVFMRRAL